MAEDLLDESVSVVNEVILHSRRVKDDELLVLLDLLDSNVLHDFFQVLDTVPVLDDRVVVAGIKGYLEETILASLSLQIGQMTDFG